MKMSESVNKQHNKTKFFVILRTNNNVMDNVRV